MLTAFSDTTRPKARDGAIAQIGERLSLSRRTVQIHVAHIFTKLGASSRVQLAAEVTRPRSRGWPARFTGRPPGGYSAPRPAQSNDGLRSRLRLSSKKPSVSVTKATPSHRRPAASPRGAGVTTGPKMA